MMKNVLIILALVSVVFVSGCIDQGDLFSGLVGPSGVDTETLSTDILSVKNVNIIPTPPITSGSSFTLTFEVENVDDINTVKDVEITKVDSGLCEFDRSNDEYKGDDAVTLVPQQVQYVEWIFNAPSQEKTGNLPVACPIKYKVAYDFEANSQVDFSVMSKEKLETLQRAGESPSFKSSQVVGRGPVKVFFDFGAAQPVKESTPFQMYLTIKDQGTGLIEGGDIGSGDLILIVPKHMAAEKTQDLVPGTTLICYDQFKLKGLTDDDNAVFENTEEIPIVKRKSPKIVCEFKSPSQGRMDSDERTYYFTAKLGYRYFIDRENEISVKPTLQ